MTNKEHENHLMYVVDIEAYREVLERLMAALGPYHHNDAELHQLYLETQWLLLSNRHSNRLDLPTKWNLLIFKMIKGHKLTRYPGIHELGLQLVSILEQASASENERTG